jgi:hypothetical protein
MLDQILEDWVANLFWMVVGFVFGIGGSLLKRLWERYQRARRNAALEQNLGRIRTSERRVNVVTLGAGPWKLSDQLSIRDTGRKFFIAFPADLLPLLQRRYEARGQSLPQCFDVHETVFLDGTSNLGAIGAECDIEDFDALLAHHRRQVALDFIHGRNGCYFNHRKYGVDELDVVLRKTDDELPCLSLELYTTDYYTHKVMRRIYKELRGRGHSIASVDDQADLNRYRAFCTSLGLNVVVCLTNEKEGMVFVLSRRSKLASETGGRSLYHVTMNEGLSITDFDPFRQQVSFPQWLSRGLEEELNLKPDVLLEHVASSSLDDVFLVRGLFEIGLAGTIDIKGMTVEELWARAQSAKDRNLEVAGLDAVPAQADKLKAFLRTHEMIAHGRYVLARIAARRGIVIDDDWWTEPAARSA